MDRWIGGQIDRWIDEMDRQIDGQIDGQMIYGQMNRWIDGELDKWLDVEINRLIEGERYISYPDVIYSINVIMNLCNTYLYIYFL